MMYLAKGMFISEFPVIDNGPIQYFLGIQVIRDSHGNFISLSQEKYIEETLAHANMSNSTYAPTPMVVNAKLAPKDLPYTHIDKSFMHDIPYDHTLGQIRYCIFCTRMDVCYIGYILSRALHEPRKVHCVALKRCLRYLHDTKAHTLTYFAGKGPLCLEAFTDADWGGHDPQMRSIAGYIFLLAGGAISWQTKRQLLVASSTTEAEYVAASLAA